MTQIDNQAADLKKSLNTLALIKGTRLVIITPQIQGNINVVIGFISSLLENEDFNISKINDKDIFTFQNLELLENKIFNYGFTLSPKERESFQLYRKNVIKAELENFFTYEKNSNPYDYQNIFIRQLREVCTFLNIFPDKLEKKPILDTVTKLKKITEDLFISKSYESLLKELDYIQRVGIEYDNKKLTRKLLEDRFFDLKFLFLKDLPTDPVSFTFYSTLIKNSDFSSDQMREVLKLQKPIAYRTIHSITKALKRLEFSKSNICEQTHQEIKGLLLACPKVEGLRLSDDQKQILINASKNIQAFLE